MSDYGDLVLVYGWMLIPVAAAVAIAVARWRSHARRTRRDQRRMRNIARQKTWDWLMRRPKARRLTYRSDDDRR